MNSLALLLLLTAPSQVESNERLQDAFYHPDTVQTVRLEISEADQQRMLDELPKRVYVPAIFRWRDIELKNVAVRFKGNSSSQPNQRFKRGYLIRFDEYEKDQRFLGMKRASLDNGIQFGSLFSEPIVTEILRDLGVKSHRCNYTKLYINGKYMGVHINVERIDDTFIKRNFADPDGALYKNDEGGPGGNLQFIGDDTSAYKKAFESKSKTAKKERKRLVQWIKQINEAEQSKIPEFLESQLELNDFLKTTAVLLYAGAFDQLTGWNAHNFYLYFDRQKNRWRFLAWDLDVGFSEVAFGRILVLADWNAAWPIPTSSRSSNPLLERIVADPNLLRQYREMADMILEKYFEPTRLRSVLDAKYALIKKDLENDPFPRRRVTNPNDKGYDDIIASMKSFMDKRYQAARQQLDKPGSRPSKSSQTQPQFPPGVTPQMAEKLTRLQQRAHRIHQFMRRIGPLIHQGKMKEAEKLMDEALSQTDGSQATKPK